MRRRKWGARRRCYLLHVRKSGGWKGWEEDQSECLHGGYGEEWAIRRRIYGARHAISSRCRGPVLCILPALTQGRRAASRVAENGLRRVQRPIRERSKGRHGQRKEIDHVQYPGRRKRRGRRLVKRIQLARTASASFLTTLDAFHSPALALARGCCNAPTLAGKGSCEEEGRPAELLGNASGLLSLARAVPSCSCCLLLVG